jgi:predicted branched-subunit amino acid permease
MINTPKDTYRRAVKDALGFPSIMLLASMTGFGSLARESGLTVGMALTTTVGIWGLPGQVALVELHAAGVSALFVILASSLANARFMPMAVSFIPLMRDGVKKFGWMFVLVQLLSINSWAAGQRSFPDIVPEMRARYYVVFALICMTAGLIGTATGFYGIGAMSRPAALGLIFLNPLFFAVLIAGTRVRPAMIAIIVGVPLGPIFHMLSPDWGLLATGLAGGTLAFWIHRQRLGAVE